MAVDVTKIFTAYFARNKGPIPSHPGRQQVPEYGVTASLEGSSVVLTLTFLSGLAYCCYEWGCHLNLDNAKFWKWLRQELSSGGQAVGETMEVRLRVVVEAGALFFDWSRPDPTRRGWYAFAPADAHQYEVVITESP